MNPCLLELTYAGGWRESGSEAITIDWSEADLLNLRYAMPVRDQYYQINKISATPGIFICRPPLSTTD
jgi:hypothetical protein